MKTTIVTVDRIEKDVAVLEFQNDTYNVPLQILPDVREGDTLEITRISSNKTLKEAEDRLNRLQKKSPKSTIIDL